MKIVPVSVDELKVQGITIGRRDTHGTEQVEFDLTELINTYGNGSAGGTGSAGIEGCVIIYY